MQNGNQYLIKRNIKAYFNLSQESGFSQGVRSVIQSIGIGKLRPNIVMIGFKSDWAQSEPKEVEEYFKAIQ